MPSFKNHAVSSRTKLMVVGDSGSGKTAALASLANAGYNVRILDFDGGLDILASYLDKEAVDRVHYVTVRDTLTNANALETAAKMIGNWKTDDEDFGPVRDWTEKDVLVIDSATMMGNAALKQALKRAGKKLTEQASQPIWGDAMREFENIISYLTSDDIKCNLVINTHIRYQEDDRGGSKAYPSCIGSKFPTIISNYFNTVVRLDVKPSKDGGTRFFRTASDFKMNLKNTAPKSLPTEMEPDLAKVFEAVQNNASEKVG